MHSLPGRSTNPLSSKFFGSTKAESTLVKILNSSETLASYPYDERPNEIVPSFFCQSTNGSIIPSSKAFFFIQLSDMIVILIFFLLPSLKLFSFS